MPRSPHPRLRALLLVLSLVTSVLVVASPAAATDGSSFVASVNVYRGRAGVPAAHLDALVDKVTVERANQLASARELTHDLDYVSRRFSQLGVCWEGMGEIIAWNSGGDPATFAQQWFNSPPHHDIMLDPQFTAAGGSWARGSDGRYYAAMLFIDPCGAATPTTTSGFTDVASSPYVNDIIWLVDAGITHGCDTDRFCPTDRVTRAQMASFLDRALDAPATSRDWFGDDDTSMHEGDINRIATADVTHGCGSDRYCPGRSVSRGQMASFLARALSLPAASRDWFSDDGDSMHQAAINELAQAGITGGCATNRFCPDAPVTRGQMAAFLHRAFGG